MGGAGWPASAVPGGGGRGALTLGLVGLIGWAPSSHHVVIPAVSRGVFVWCLALPPFHDGPPGDTGLCWGTLDPDHREHRPTQVTCQACQVVCSKSWKTSSVACYSAHVGTLLEQPNDRADIVALDGRLHRGSGSAGQSLRIRSHHALFGCCGSMEDSSSFSRNSAMQSFGRGDRFGERLISSISPEYALGLPPLRVFLNVL